MRYIYMLLFPNGKYYLGQTYDMKKRIADHHRIRGNSSHNIYLERAIKKYGFENIIIHILAYTTEKEADKKERYFIAAYGANIKNIGYNIEAGGKRNKTMTEATKKKLRKINLGKKHTAETKKKMSRLKLEYYKKERERNEGITSV